jgi:hypothetical protein
MDYRYWSQTVFQIEFHFVWVTKYRYKVLTAEVGESVAGGPSKTPAQSPLCLFK